MKKSTHPLMQLLVMLAISLGLLLVITLVEGVLSHFLEFNIMDRSSLLWTQALTQIITMGLPVVLMVLIYHRSDGTSFLKLNANRGAWGMALAGVVSLLLLMPLTDWLGTWNDSWQLGAFGESLRQMQDRTEGLLEDFMSATTVGGLLVNLLVVAIIPAVCEELFFRCGIQNQLQAWTRNPHVAVWLTAVIFSIGHGEVFSFMPRVLLGVLLGYCYVYGKSVVPNMLLHFVNNAIVVVLSWLYARGVVDINPDEPLHFATWTVIICSVAAIFLMATTIIKGQKTSR